MTPEARQGLRGSWGGRRGTGLGAGAMALVKSPSLWRTAAVQMAVLARPGWWRRWPPLPRPAPGYLRFRLETAYGSADAEMVAGDVIEYLSWCRKTKLVSR